jgi:hypothetical protein
MENSLHVNNDINSQNVRNIKKFVKKFIDKIKSKYYDSDQKTMIEKGFKFANKMNFSDAEKFEFLNQMVNGGIDPTYNPFLVLSNNEEDVLKTNLDSVINNIHKNNIKSTKKQASELINIFKSHYLSNDKEYILERFFEFIDIKLIENLTDDNIVNEHKITSELMFEFYDQVINDCIDDSFDPFITKSKDIDIDNISEKQMKTLIDIYDFYHKYNKKSMNELIKNSKNIYKSNEELIVSYEKIMEQNTVI